MIRSNSIIATPPGATIKEQLEDRHMTQKEFAERMGMSPKHISHLINGDVQLTPDVAIRLESVLGVPAKFWNNLEAIYQDKKARAIQENEMEEDIQLITGFRYSEIHKLGWVESATKPADKVRELRKFFEVYKLSVLTSNRNLLPGIAFRQLSTTNNNDLLLLVWAQKAKIEAREIPTNAINVQRLEKLIPKFREMTMQNPNVFCGELVRLMASCGIAIVFLPHLKGSYLHGATFFDGKKIVMGLTVRGKDADKFWFSFFHELAHVILGHVGKPEGTTESDEIDADRFASNALIPDDYYNSVIEITKHRAISKSDIIMLARTVDVAPGIVLGRLQKDGYVDFSYYNDLKEKYSIID